MAIKITNRNVLSIRIKLIETTHEYEDGDIGKYTSWLVETGDKKAENLTFDEMLGLVASITIPCDNRPCLHWLKTKKQLAAEKKHRKRIYEKTNSTIKSKQPQ